MTFNIADPVSWILQFPGFLKDLRDLIRGSKDSEFKKAAEDQLNEVIKRVLIYGEMHFALNDWKLIHEEVQRLQDQLINTREFSPFIEDKEATPSMVNEAEKRWESFRLRYLDPFYSKEKDIKYIKKAKIKMQDPKTYREEEFDIFEKIRDFHREIQNSYPKENANQILVEAFSDLRDFLNASMVNIDGEIRRLAGDLASLSLKLNAVLEQWFPQKTTQENK